VFSGGPHFAGLPGHRAVEWLRALSESIQIADVPKEKADLMHAIYERITVAGPDIVGHELARESPRATDVSHRRPRGYGCTRHRCFADPRYGRTVKRPPVSGRRTSKWRWSRVTIVFFVR
jgi:hypothetical protein